MRPSKRRQQRGFTCRSALQTGFAKSPSGRARHSPMVEFCQAHSIPHEICGKVVVASSEEEIPRLKALLERGQQNGLRNLRWLSGEELREIEPHAAGLAAVRVPEEGKREIHGSMVTSARVTAIRREGAGWRVVSTSGDYVSDRIVTCAGLHSDRVAAMTGRPREVRIVPFRGEYYKIRPERQSLVHNLIYPVPDPKFPFLGVHFTRLIHGGVEAGPNAVLALARRDTQSRASVSAIWPMP